VGRGKIGHKGTDTAHLEAEGGIDKPGLLEKARKERFARRRIVDLTDEQARAAALAAHRDFRKLLCKLLSEVSTIGFALRKRNPNGRIATPEKRGYLTVDKNDC